MSGTLWNRFFSRPVLVPRLERLRPDAKHEETFRFTATGSGITSLSQAFKKADLMAFGFKGDELLEIAGFSAEFDAGASTVKSGKVDLFRRQRGTGYTEGSPPASDFIAYTFTPNQLISIVLASERNLFLPLDFQLVKSDGQMGNVGMESAAAANLTVNLSLYYRILSHRSSLNPRVSGW